MSDNLQTKKKGGCLKTVLIVFIILVVLGGIGSSFGGSSDSDKDTTTATKDNSTSEGEKPKKDSTEDAEEEKTTEKATTEAPKKETFKKTFGPGYYTAGIHFPAGKYKLVAKKGGGNAFSTDGLNQIMGIEDNGIYIQEYNNETFDDGDVLIITSTLNLSLSCKDADLDGMSKLDNTAKKSVTLNSGKYIAGEDFEMGIYDIIAVKGMGNVFSSNGINQIMGPQEDDMYIKTFKNAPLDEGVELELSGVSVKLVPSK